MTREQRLRSLVADTLQLFERHELLLDEVYWDQGRGARWCIGRRGTSVGRTEIVAGVGGSLVVHGDYDLVRFAHYGDRGDAWSRLLWLAAGHAAVDDYTHEKAQIGTGHRFHGSYDPEVARSDLLEEIAELEASGDQADLVEVLRGALQWCDEEHELRDYLTSHDERWDLWERSYGQVIPQCVVTAAVALVTCARLLRERHGAEGPPACRGDSDR